MSVEIDWNSEMAKGSNYCLVTKKGSITSFSFVKHVESALDEDTTIYERPKAEKQSVYTQEMADAGEFPKVGMSFLAFNPACADYVKFVCISEGLRLSGGALISAECVVDGSILFFDKRHIDSDGLKPICANTDKQKTIDALKNCHRAHQWTEEEFFEDVFGEIKKGNIPDLKYTGKDND